MACTRASGACRARRRDTSTRRLRCRCAPRDSPPFRRVAARSSLWRAAASRSDGSGKARLTERRSARRRSSRRNTEACSLRASSPNRIINSERTGTTISAAPVGVGARRSAARSSKDQSVSWPMAAISGIIDWLAARTTRSSLKPHRSSIDPPPRATISTSGRGIGPCSGSALKPSMARVTSSAQVSPCTRTGQTSTWRGKRSARRCKISRITAPVGEVTTPMTCGRNGSNCLRSSSNRPSAARRRLRSSSWASNAPSPAGSIVSMTS